MPRETRKKNKYRLPALKWQTLKYRKLTQMLREIKYLPAALQQMEHTQLTKMQRERNRLMNPYVERKFNWKVAATLKWQMLQYVNLIQMLKERNRSMILLCQIHDVQQPMKKLLFETGKCDQFPQNKRQVAKCYF